MSEPSLPRAPAMASEPVWLARWLNQFNGRAFLRLTNTAKMIERAKANESTPGHRVSQSWKREPIKVERTSPRREHQSS
jgi:hypothetical protein